MNNNRKTLIITIALAGAIALVIALAVIFYPKLSKALSRTGAEEARVENAEKADPFMITDDEGQDVDLSDYLGKKPVIVNCWATWCPPCKAELPDFDKAYSEYGDRIDFFMVNLLSREDEETARSFVAESGYSFPIFYDKYREISKEYKIQYIPVTLVFDKNGTLVYNKVGQASPDELAVWIDSVLSD